MWGRRIWGEVVRKDSATGGGKSDPVRRRVAAGRAKNLKTHPDDRNGWYIGG
jgi:hypothetical protein